MTTERHNSDDYNCVHWTGDRSGTDLSARCGVCARPGFKQAYAQREAERRRQEASDGIGMIGVGAGVVFLIMLGLHALFGWF